MIAFLIAASILLGALAFFEPCAIATHTLFTARAHGQEKSRCCRSLLAVWAARTLLLAGLLAGLTWASAPPPWSTHAPSVLLAALATLYLVSRFVYVPVPHLGFHRLLPGGARLPHALQLGLTLPACALPLFAVVAAIAITLDSVAFAVLAGALFAGFFTLPMAFAAFKGLHAEGRDLLGRAARGSPFLTAALLYGVALYLFVPTLDLSVDTLGETLEQASLWGIVLSFLAGFVFSFNPVALASIPVVLAYVTKAREERRARMLGGAFIAGIVVTHGVLGVAAALGGEWVQAVLGRQWALLLGPLLIVMGLLWPGWLKLRLPWIGLRGRRVAGPWGAFLLGIPFSVAVCPFCTPALLVALTAAAAVGSVPFGLALLLAFALGRAIPIALGAWGMGWLESLQMLSRHQKAIEVAAGLTLILTGLYLLNEYFFIVQY